MSRLSHYPIFVDGSRCAVYTITSDTPSITPILFIHGWGLSPRSYERYIQSLSVDSWADVFAPALPGFGGSDPLPEGADEERLVTHLSTTIEQLGFDTPPILVGHSLGGALAARIAARHGSLVDNRMVLISPAGIHSRSGRGAGEAVAMAMDLRFELPHSPWQRIMDAGPSFVRHPRAVFQAGWTASQIDITEDLALLSESGKEVFLVTAEDDHVTPFEAATKVQGVHVEKVEGTHGWVLSSPNHAAKITARLLAS